MTNYLRDFIIGSSWPVFILFFLSVMNITAKNYTYDFYTVVAPVYLGLMNVLANFLQEKYQLTSREKYWLIGIISPLTVIAIAYFGNAYPYTPVQWDQYMVRIIFNHFLAFNVIIYHLDLWV